MFPISGVRLLIACLGAFLIATALAKQIGVRIVQQHASSIDVAPYIVQLRAISENGRHFCSGSLVTLQYVVTAAHCFDKRDSKDTLVVAGVTSSTDKGVQREILYLIRPIDYTPGHLHMDVAVLKLKDPMEGPHIAPLRLCSKPWKLGGHLEVSGWGPTSSDAPALAPLLRTISLPMMQRMDCLKSQGSELTSSMECTYGSGLGICLSEAGSPAVYHGELCGIVSSDRECEDRDYTAVYTNVYAVRDFLDSVIKK